MTSTRPSSTGFAPTIALAAVALTAAFILQPGFLGAAGPQPGPGPGVAAADQPDRRQGGRSARAEPAPGADGWKWWKDPEIKKAIGLSDEKAQRIEGLFAAREAEARPLVERLIRERDRLSRMTSERVADEATYAAQVYQVESLWMRLRESRTIMLYRMFLELQPEQYRKLEEFSDQRRQPNGRGRGSSAR